MSDESNKNADDFTQSAISRVISQIGISIAHTKDAILKDLLDDMPAYLPDLSLPKSESYPYSAFKEKIDEGKTPLLKYVETLFTRIGYDISSFEKNTQLTDLVRSIIAITISLGECLKQLFDGKTFDFMKEAKDCLDNLGKGKSDDEKPPVQHLFSPEGLNKIIGGSGNSGGSGGAAGALSNLNFGDDKLSAILKLVLDLVSLIKNIHDLKWNEMKATDDFGKFVDRNNFSEQLAARIFDHIFIILLRNANDILSDDINVTLDGLENNKEKLDALKTSLMDEAKKKAAKAEDKDFNETKFKEKLDENIIQIKALRKEIIGLEKKIAEETAAVQKDAKDNSKTIIREIPTQLPIRLRIARAKLEKLYNEVFGGYNLVGKTLSIIFAILEFLKVFDTETAQMAVYKNPYPIDGPSIEEIDGWITQAIGDDADKSKEAVGKLKNYSVVRINVIRWDNIIKLFTEPVGFFMETNLIRDLDEAEAVLARVMKLIRLFNPDTPDFGSLRKLLFEFMIRLWDKIQELKEINNSSGDDKKDEKADKLKLIKFENFIIDLIKVQEKFAVAVKLVMNKEYEKFKGGTVKGEGEGEVKAGEESGEDSLIDGLKKLIKTGFEDEELKFPKLEAEYLNTWFTKPFVRAVVKKADGHDLYGKISSKDWEDAANRSLFTKNGDCAKELEKIRGFVKDPFYSETNKTWETKFDKIINAMKEDFKWRAGNVSDNFNNARKLWKDDPGAVNLNLENFGKLEEFFRKGEAKQIAGDAKLTDGESAPKDSDGNDGEYYFDKKEGRLYGPKSDKKWGDFTVIKGNCFLVKDPGNADKYLNPISDFDYIKYFSDFSDSLKTIVPNDLDIYYIKFREITVRSMMTDSTLKSKISSGGDSEEKFRPFLEDAFASSWQDMKVSLYKAVLLPFDKKIAKVVKDWLKEKAMRAVMAHVVGGIPKENYPLGDINGDLSFDGYKGDIFSDADSAGFEGKLKYIEHDYAGDSSESGSSNDPWALSTANIARNLLSTPAKAEDIVYWEDGLQFALKLYKLIPKDLEKKLTGLLYLPGLSFGGVKLPNYKLDLKNKLIVVPVWEYPDKSKKDGNKGTSGGTGSTDSIEIGVSVKLVAFIGEKNAKDDDGNDVLKDGKNVKEAGIFLLPIIRANGSVPIDLGESKNYQLIPGISLELNRDFTITTPDGKKPNEQAALENGFIGLFFNTKEGKDSISAEFLSKDENFKDSFKAFLELLFTRKKKDGELKPQTIFESEYAGLTIKNYPQKLYLGYVGGAGDKITNHDFEIGCLSKLEELNLSIRLHKLNDFFKAILSNDIIIGITKLELEYNKTKGLRVEGEFKVRIPLNKDIDLKVIKLSNLIIEIGTSVAKENSISAKLLTNLKVDFSGIMLSFIEMGFGVDMNYMTKDKKFGDLKFSPEFQFPSGIAVSVDLSAVKGTGVIRWNKEKEEFLGALELNILDMCGASALVLFNMKMPDGGEGFSFMGALSVFFKMGIQIGMGFSLTAIGGSLGINRGIDTDKLRDAVRDGSLGSILFVKDLAKNLDIILNNISSYYPVKRDQFFFGFLAQITWTDILKADVGIFVQAPNPVTISIAGGIHVSISDSTESLLAIHVYFLGTIDFNKGLDFDASLVDSKVVGIELYGDMAMRIYWAGDTKGFIMSVGGFHPLYKPEEGFRLGTMRRLGMKLDYDILKISLETYFAITSNTVQFGAALQLKVGWDKFGLFGELSFNALFQFRPFSFMVDVTVSIAAKCGNWTLASIKLALALSGPAPWNAKGEASFSFLFIKIDVGFNKTWGKKQTISDKKYIEVVPQFTKNFHETGNWKITSGDIVDGLVSLFQPDVAYGESPEDEPPPIMDLVMQPSDRLSFSQSAVPLRTKMLRYGEAFPGDAQEIELQELKIGGVELNSGDYRETTSSFAPSLIRPLEESEKLRLPSYENMTAGFELSASFGMEKGAGLKMSMAPIDKKCENAAWIKWRSLLDGSGKYTVSASISPAADVKTDSGVSVKSVLTIAGLTPDRPAASDNLSLLPESSQLSDSVKGRKADWQRLSEILKPAKPRPGETAEKISVSSRATLRRMNNGFKRYTRELDVKMNRKLDNLIDKLKVEPGR